MAAQLGRGCRPGAGVEGGQRLVEQQHPGLGGERPGQRHPLGLPARQRGRAGRPPGRARPTRSSSSWARGPGLGGGARPGPAARTRRCRGRSGGGTAGGPGRPRRSVGRRWGRSTPAAGSSRTRPSTVMRPASMGWRPATARRSVVLPAPLGPSTATTSPSATSTSTARSRSPRRRRHVGVQHAALARQPAVPQRAPGRPGTPPPAPATGRWPPRGRTRAPGTRPAASSGCGPGGCRRR